MEIKQREKIKMNTKCATKKKGKMPMKLVELHIFVHARKRIQRTSH
jgi:hypothetical protein